MLFRSERERERERERKRERERGRGRESLKCWGFPGGAVVENPPASAGDTGPSPGPGRSHMPQSNQTCAAQLLKPARLEPVLRNY